jgi:hypothetical protein
LKKYDFYKKEFSEETDLERLNLQPIFTPEDECDPAFIQGKKDVEPAKIDYFSRFKSV